MKKLPIILSAAAITATSVTALTPKVLASEGGIVPQGQHLFSLALSENLLDSSKATSGRGVNKIFLDSNHMADELYPSLIELSDSYSLNLRDAMYRDWRPQWLTVAWMDYENGITEEMADAKLETLGVEDPSDWAVLYTDLKVPQTTLAGRTWKVNDEVHLFDNKSDILYYAVRWAREVEQDDGTVVLEDDYWTRGKIDYRQCVHSSSFDVATTRCRIVPTDLDGTFTFEVQRNSPPYDIIPYPEDEEVIIWGEEWREILRERSEKYSDRMAALADFLSNPDKFLDDAEGVIQRMLKVLPGLGDMNDVYKETQRTQVKLNLVRKLYSNFNSGGFDGLEETIERLEAERDNLVVTIAGLEEEKASLANDNTDLNNKLAEARMELSEAKEMISQLEQVKSQLEERIELLESELNRDGATELLEEVNKLKSEIVGLESENDKLEGRITEETKQRETLEKENSQLRVEIEKLKGEASGKCNEVRDNGVVGNDDAVGNDSNQGGLNVGVNYGDGSAEKVVQGDGGEDGNSEMNRDEEAKGEDLENGEAEDEKSQDGELKNEEAGVPILGGAVSEEGGRWNWWWVLIPMVAATGSLIFWIKRALHKNR